MNRLIRVLAALLASTPAFAQNVPLQGGPWAPGHTPMYSVGSGSQPIIQDSGKANGGATGLGLSELLQVNRAGNGDTVAPFASNGNGPLSTHNCFYDAPTTNATGYHYLCLDANAQGGGLIAYGAGGGATVLPFQFNINGIAWSPLSGAITGTPNTVATFSSSGALVGSTTLPTGLTSPNLTVTTAFTAPGLVVNSDLANMAANTVKCNATGLSAPPTDCTTVAALPNLPITPFDYGAYGDGSHDDTSALANWAAASYTSGKATYCPPGVYQTSQMVVFNPFQSSGAPLLTPQTWAFDKACTIKATAAMAAVAKFGDGSSYNYLVRNGLVQGGVFDANHLAYSAVWAPFHNNITIRDTLAKNGVAKQYRIGDVNSIAASYGATLVSADTYTDAPVVGISGITKANPAVVTTSAAHGLTSNQVVWIEAAGGMTQVNSAYYAVTVTGSTTFSLNNTDSSAWTTYTSGGTVHTTNNGTTQPFFITGISSASSAVVTTSTAHGFATSQTAFVYGIQSTGSTIVDGTCTISAVTTNTFTCSNINTASNFTYSSGGVAFLYVIPSTITGISNANPAVVTATNTFSNGQTVFVEAVVGMGGNAYGNCTVASASGSSFSCSNWNSTGWGAYTSGGQAIQNIYNPVYGMWAENADNVGGIGPSNFEGNTIGWGGLSGNGLPYDGSVTGFHFWNVAYNGEILAAFDVGGREHLTNINVDAPFRWGFRFRDILNSVTASELLYNNYGATNGEAAPIRLESGASASAVSNQWFASSSSYKMIQEAVGPSLANNIWSINNAYQNFLVANYIGATSTPAQAGLNLCSSGGCSYINAYGTSPQLSGTGTFSVLSGSNFYKHLTVDDKGHWGNSSTAEAPSVSSCGTSPGSVTGNDLSGHVTEGTTATGCTIAFKAAYGTAPTSCTVSLSSGTAAGISTLSTSQLIVTHASVSGNTLYWTCLGN